MSVVKLSSKGQVVIPAEIRRAMKLGRSTRLRVEVQGNSIVLRPFDTEGWRSLRGCLQGESLTVWLEEEHGRERGHDKKRPS